LALHKRAKRLVGNSLLLTSISNQKLLKTPAKWRLLKLAQKNIPLRFTTFRAIMCAPRSAVMAVTYA